MLKRLLPERFRPMAARDGASGDAAAGVQHPLGWRVSKLVMRHALIASVLGGFLLWSAPEAAAQSDAYMNLMRTQHQQMMNRVRIYSSVRSGARITRYTGATKFPGATARPQRTAKLPIDPQPSVAQAVATRFRPVAPSIMDKQMALEIARTPTERASLEKLFNELLANYRDRLRRSGGAQNDVARAAAYLISSSYDAYHGASAALLSPREFNALRVHMEEVYAADGKFRRASDRERQEMFETFAIIGTWIDAGSKTAKAEGNRDGLRHWREMARGQFENMIGAPPERVRLGLNGIEYL